MNTNHPTYIFCITLRNDNDKLVFNKLVKVKRATYRSAKDYLIAKFPHPYFIELDNINFK